jgi:hypothetical protein
MDALGCIHSGIRSVGEGYAVPTEDEPRPAAKEEKGFSP